jgi:opacity protein-like surface antigen
MRLTHHVGVLAMLGALAVPAAPANAGQDPRRAQVATQYGYDEGYRQGLRVGEDHGRRGQQFNFGVAIEYRQGDYGWRPSYGSRDQYRADFRLGFERGYRLGYGQYGQYGGYRTSPPPWSNGRDRGASDLAFSNGFDDGYKEGLNDGRHRHRNDPYAESRYRSADHGFEKWYGSREQYRLSYRDAFRRGYERGFSEGWHR